MLSTSNNITEGRMAVLRAAPRKRPPTHPGRIIASALDGLGVAPNAAAKAIGVTAQALGNVIRAKTAMTPNMALRIGTYLGNGPEIWLGLQADYDIWHERVKLTRDLAKITPAPKDE